MRSAAYGTWGMWQLPFKTHLFKVFLEGLVMYGGCFTPCPSGYMQEDVGSGGGGEARRNIVQGVLWKWFWPVLKDQVSVNIHALHMQ